MCLRLLFVNSTYKRMNCCLRLGMKIPDYERRDERVAVTAAGVAAIDAVYRCADSDKPVVDSIRNSLSLQFASQPAVRTLYAAGCPPRCPSPTKLPPIYTFYNIREKSFSNFILMFLNRQTSNCLFNSVY